VPHSLVLNASYEPLCVVPQRRAVVLVLNQKAVTLEESGAPLHAAAFELPAPSVVKLTRYVRVPMRRGVPLTAAPSSPRFRALCVLRRPGDQHRPRHSAFARRSARLGQRRLLLPQVQPREGDRPLMELGWRMKRQPVQPSGSPGGSCPREGPTHAGCRTSRGTEPMWTCCRSSPTGRTASSSLRPTHPSESLLNHRTTAYTQNGSAAVNAWQHRRPERRIPSVTAL